MREPSSEEIFEFHETIKLQAASRGERFRAGVCSFLEIEHFEPENKFEEPQSFDIRQESVRLAIEESILLEFNLMDEITRGSRLLHWMHNEPAMQLAFRRGFSPITESDVRRVVKSRIARLLVKIDDKDDLIPSWRRNEAEPSKEKLEEMAERYACICQIPLAIERWLFSSWEWYAEIGLAIHNYKTGRGVRASEEIADELKKAIKGLDAYIEAVSSSAAGYFQSGFGWRYPLSIDEKSNFSRGIRQRLAGLKAMEERVGEIKLIKRRDRYARERAFIAEVISSNYKIWGNGLKKATKEIAKSAFLDNPVEEKTVERVYDLVKKQRRAFWEIRETLKTVGR